MHSTNAAVLAGVNVQCSQSSPCSARSRAPVRGSGLLRASLDPGCARRPSGRVGTRGVAPRSRSGRFDSPCGRRRTRGSTDAYAVMARRL